MLANYVLTIEITGKPFINSRMLAECILETIIPLDELSNWRVICLERQIFHPRRVIRLLARFLNVNANKQIKLRKFLLTPDLYSDELPVSEE